MHNFDHHIELFKARQARAKEGNRTFKAANRSSADNKKRSKNRKANKVAKAARRRNRG